MFVVIPSNVKHNWKALLLAQDRFTRRKDYAEFSKKHGKDNQLFVHLIKTTNEVDFKN